jgi:hypothetical protein
MSSTVSGWLMVTLGFLIMLGSALNWRVISRSGKILNMIIGDTAARIVYFILGIVFFIMGLNQLTGLNWFNL